MIAVPAAAVTAPAAAVKAAAAVTGGLDNIGGHGRRRGGDRCRLSRRGIGHGRWCGGNSDRGSTRRQRWCDVLQSDSPSCYSFAGAVSWTVSRIALQRSHVVTADTTQCFPTSWNLCLPVNSQRRGGRVIRLTTSRSGRHTTWRCHCSEVTCRPGRWSTWPSNAAAIGTAPLDHHQSRVMRSLERVRTRGSRNRDSRCGRVHLPCVHPVKWVVPRTVSRR